MTLTKIGANATVLCALVLAGCGQAPAPAPTAAAPVDDTKVAHVFDSQLSGVEKEMVPLVKEVPESAFSFAPKQGAFKGARTFAEQAKHVAAVNYLVAAAILGEKPPVDLGKGESGPETVKSKDEVVKFLEDSFAYTHKAMNSMTAKNQVDMIKPPFPGAKDVARASLAILAVSHSFDHYGQMVVYSRMNNVVPPASR